MRARSMIVLAALTATLVLAMTAGATSANRLRFSDAGFLFKWKAESPLTFAAFGFSASCEVRLKGTFHTTSFAKVRQNLVGSVTQASARQPCEGNGAWILNGTEFQIFPEVPFATSLPWNLRYFSFSGRLPAISSITFAIVGMSVLIQSALESCLYRTTEAEPFVMIATREAGGGITALRADETATILVTRGNRELCRELTPNGVATEITRFAKGAVLTVNLI
jgi:hypothetical protein